MNRQLTLVHDAVVRSDQIRLFIHLSAVDLWSISRDAIAMIPAVVQDSLAPCDWQLNLYAVEAFPAVEGIDFHTCVYIS